MSTLLQYRLLGIGSQGAIVFPALPLGDLFEPVPPRKVENVCDWVTKVPVKSQLSKQDFTLDREWLMYERALANQQTHQNKSGSSYNFLIETKKAQWPDSSVIENMIEELCAQRYLQDYNTHLRFRVPKPSPQDVSGQRTVLHMRRAQMDLVDLAGPAGQQLSSKGAISLRSAVSALANIFSAVDSLESGPYPMFHGDLRPENILVDADGRFVLTDWGLAGLCKEIELGELCMSTSHITPPEHFANDSGKAIAAALSLHRIMSLWLRTIEDDVSAILQTVCDSAVDDTDSDGIDGELKLVQEERFLLRSHNQAEEGPDHAHSANDTEADATVTVTRARALLENWRRMISVEIAQQGIAPDRRKLFAHYDVYGMGSLLFFCLCVFGSVDDWTEGSGSIVDRMLSLAFEMMCPNTLARPSPATALRVFHEIQSFKLPSVGIFCFRVWKRCRICRRRKKGLLKKKK